MSPQITSQRKMRDDVRITPIGRRTRTRAPRQPNMSARQVAEPQRGQGLAKFLGVFSLGLGLAEMLAPKQLAELIGIEPDSRNCKLLRAMGAREFLNGVAVLASSDPSKAMWARVSGDAVDIACLGTALANEDNDRRKTAFATANVLAVTAMDVLCATRLSSSESRRSA